MGGLDRTLRIVFAVVVALLYWQNIISGTLAYVLMGAAGILLLTSLVNFCPIYRVLGINSCKVS